MIIEKLTSTQIADIKAILEKHKNGTKAEKALAITELAAYVNRGRLGLDTVCPICPKAKELMQYAMTRFAVTAKVASKKKAVKADAPTPETEPTQEDAIIE